MEEVPIKPYMTSNAVAKDFQQVFDSFLRVDQMSLLFQQMASYLEPNKLFLQLLPPPHYGSH